MDKKSTEVEAKGSDLAALRIRVVDLKSAMSTFEQDFFGLKINVFKEEDKAPKAEEPERPISSNRITEIDDLIGECFEIQNRIQSIFGEFHKLLQ